MKLALQITIYSIVMSLSFQANPTKHSEVKIGKILGIFLNKMDSATRIDQNSVVVPDSVLYDKSPNFYSYSHTLLDYRPSNNHYFKKYQPTSVNFGDKKAELSVVGLVRKSVNIASQKYFIEVWALNLRDVTYFYFQAITIDDKEAAIYPGNFLHPATWVTTDVNAHIQNLLKGKMLDWPSA
ncbi:MAG: hypothetical protein KC505_09970 [Myxococcales bacterium]|nr:hypothetical protein [Myxococcales bacterium]USN50927.1 MAG: hypothetical protein H6731_00475 [Myxococcales bacterium]